MILDCIGMIIPCLIFSSMIYGVLYVFILHWFLGTNARIIVFLAIFSMAYTSAIRGLEDVERRIAMDRYNAKATRQLEMMKNAHLYEKVVKEIDAQD